MIDITNAKNYSFILQRRTGKNKTLNKGNQILNSNDRMHYIVKSQITEYLRTLSCQMVSIDNDKEQYNEDNPCDVVITVHPPTIRRIDAPNFYPTIKALIDGMTDAGLWSDDNNHIIKSMTFVLGDVTDNKKYKFDISIVGYNR